MSRLNFGGSGSSGSTILRHVHMSHFQTKIKETNLETHESSVTSHEHSCHFFWLVLQQVPYMSQQHFITKSVSLTLF